MKSSKILCLFFVLVFITSCNFTDINYSDNSIESKPDLIASATLERYRPDELREFNGTKLDPAVGPRDNSIKGIQNIDISTYELNIDGLVSNPTVMKYDDVLKLPPNQLLLTLHCVEGWDATLLFKGVLMKDLLSPVNVKSDAKTVIFHATDGYTTSLPLKEILDKNLMMAYNANDLPLPSALGFPFIFVAENKWGYKWARWINRIELSSDTNYKGYWENLGYDNDAEYSK